ncbi:reverse transcriptase [Quillaja saponaria]|uniref:Reverse transcriptase n=1 Tax=Quillaja saponaria TaxID=32244 RepID=A0AAD7KWS6_QUISA|nr:reverse transcriptase [Quillaja saponaria]
MERIERGERDRSLEEEDQLHQSNKKVKMGNGRNAITQENYPPLGDGLGKKLSYKESVVGANTMEERMECEEDMEKSKDEDMNVESDDDMKDLDQGENDDCPIIFLTKEEKKRIRQPWRESVIIKLLGKKIGYNFLCKKLYQIWKPKGVLKVIDLGNDFFLVRLGDPIKCDSTTSKADLENFARICVEIDLSKPLKSKYRLSKQIRRFEYEGLHLVCFKCGTYGHVTKLCPQGKKNSQEVQEEEYETQVIMEEVDHRWAAQTKDPPADNTGKYGDWMLVKKGQRSINAKGNFGRNNKAYNMPQMDNQRQNGKEIALGG